ncbi:uncharacterized protein LOC110254899 isoform X1 [Exaiptasia diaphana]|uniref:DED domain-containing protein n=1 Tax=Exaiptasia diaphana TaxID=2652724 RepID=A0A913YAA4_EXADI|nr:uncharacterized protein LOC110254899 isoform X1 [Exaiptasia diaphana]
MLRACRPLLQQILLRISLELTSQERAQFFFYCEKSFPSSPSKGQLLELFCELQKRLKSSSSVVSLLKDFTKTICRLDLELLLMEYETEIEVDTIFKEYLHFREGNQNPDLSSATARTVSKTLSRNLRDGQELLTNLAKLSKSTSIEEAVRLYLDEVLSREGKFCWSSILQILGFCSELAYRRMCLFPGPSMFQRWLSDIDDVRLVLQEFKIVTWMAQNGGAAGCVKFIKKQDPAEMARQKETRILISQIAEQYTTL